MTCSESGSGTSPRFEVAVFGKSAMAKAKCEALKIEARGLGDGSTIIRNESEMLGSESAMLGGDRTEGAVKSKQKRSEIKQMRR